MYWIFSEQWWLATSPFYSGVNCQCINVILAQPRVHNDNLAGTQLHSDNFQAASASPVLPSNSGLSAISPTWFLNQLSPVQGETISQMCDSDFCKAGVGRMILNSGSLQLSPNADMVLLESVLLNMKLFFPKVLTLRFHLQQEANAKCS